MILVNFLIRMTVYVHTWVQVSGALQKPISLNTPIFLALLYTVRQPLCTWRFILSICRWENKLQKAHRRCSNHSQEFSHRLRGLLWNKTPTTCRAWLSGSQHLTDPILLATLLGNVDTDSFMTLSISASVPNSRLPFKKGQLQKLRDEWS